MWYHDMARELVAQMTVEEKMEQMRYEAPAIPRLGVKAYNWWNECLHGVARAGQATAFPQAIAMAASFNTDLMYKTATAISDEARAKHNAYKKVMGGDTDIYQGLTYWSPNINIFRDPRWGRGQETYGEDPYLSGRMGTAFIKGLQGEGKYRKLDATIKHYAVHSGPEALRHSFDAVVNDKDLWETYLAAFKYCIDHAKPSAVMGAYNRINGEHSCASPTYLQQTLRETMGFDGYVVSDCGAVKDIHENHHITQSYEESVALAVNNGCDLNCGTAYQYLKSAYEQGMISEETITRSVERLFAARFRLGMFADDCEYDKISLDVVECDKHIEINRKMAQESIVLLKNNGVLPLKKGTRVALVGPYADSMMVLLGNYYGTPTRYYTFLRGMQEYGNPLCAKGCHSFDEKPSKHSGYILNEALAVANAADVVVMFMGIDPTIEGEQNDRFSFSMAGGDSGGDRSAYCCSGDKMTLELPPSQRAFYEKMKRCGKPIVYVNVSGSCLNLAAPKEDCDAVLQCFYPGAMGGLALADILYGTVSPSGRLPVTFYEGLADLPMFEDYSMENRTYKFYKGTPVYEFGYGLTYSEIEEKWLDENTVQLTNKGDFDTAYTVLKFEYIPHKNLCGFEKVFIKKKETITVVIK